MSGSLKRATVAVMLALVLAGCGSPPTYVYECPAGWVAIDSYAGDPLMPLSKPAVQCQSDDGSEVKWFPAIKVPA